MKAGSSSGSVTGTAGGLGITAEVRLRSHGPTFSTQDLVVNPDVVACQVGDVLRLASLDDSKGILLQVSDTSKVKGNVQVSIANYIGTAISCFTFLCFLLIPSPSFQLSFSPFPSLFAAALSRTLLFITLSLCPSPSRASMLAVVKCTSSCVPCTANRSF